MAQLTKLNRHITTLKAYIESKENTTNFPVVPEPFYREIALLDESVVFQEEVNIIDEINNLSAKVDELIDKVNELS